MKVRELIEQLEKLGRDNEELVIHTDSDGFVGFTGIYPNESGEGVELQCEVPLTRFDE